MALRAKGKSRLIEERATSPNRRAHMNVHNVELARAAHADRLQFHCPHIRSRCI